MKMIIKNKVAICIPYYNNYEALERLLISIKIQSFKDYFVIITDDGNECRAKKLSESYGFQYYANDTKMGATANCNQAIWLAEKYNPQYIKIMHQDDYFTVKESLQILVNMLDNNTQVDIAFSGTRQDDGKNPFNRSILLEENAELRKNINYLLYANVIGGPSSVIVRNKSIKLDEKLIWLVDVDWYIKILKSNCNYLFTTKPLIGVGINAKQLTNSCEKDKQLVLEEYAYLYYKHFGLNSSVEMRTLVKKLCWSLRNDTVQREIYYDYEIAIMQDYVRDRKPVAIFGAGKRGSGVVYQKVQQMGGNIVCFCDNNSALWGKQIIDGIICIPLEELKLYSDDICCFVSTSKDILGIKQQLDNANIKFYLPDMVCAICQI